MPWYALRHDGQYLRLRWQLFHQIGDPIASLDIQQAALQFNLVTAQSESRRVAATIGVHFEPVAVRIVGRGPDATITLAHPTFGGLEP